MYNISVLIHSCKQSTDNQLTIDTKGKKLRKNGAHTGLKVSGLQIG